MIRAGILIQNSDQFEGYRPVSDCVLPMAQQTRPEMPSKENVGGTGSKASQIERITQVSNG